MSSTMEEDTKLDDAWLIDTPHAHQVTFPKKRGNTSSNCFYHWMAIMSTDNNVPQLERLMIYH